MFFISWFIFVVLTTIISVGEVIVIFLHLILFANTPAFFRSPLGLVSVPHSLWEGDNDDKISTKGHCVEKITHAILGLF